MLEKLPELLQTVGLDEPPLAVYYADDPPGRGLCPEPGVLPTRADEAAGRVDFAALSEQWSCMLRYVWRARRRQEPAWFSAERFGCYAGAHYLGLADGPLRRAINYVSTGVPGEGDGERALPSPEAVAAYYAEVAPQPAPSRCCVFAPADQVPEGVEPLFLCFFARPEPLAGLHQLATFATGDLHIVRSPFGSGCASLLAWPRHHAERGEEVAVLGGWDVTQRKYLGPNELSFTVSPALLQRMLDAYEESFLRTRQWATHRKRIDKHRR